jgi:hypothetical protein
MGRLTKNIFGKGRLGGFMAEAISGIPELIEAGAKFTWENFANKNQRAFPIAYSDAWLVWTHQVGELSRKLGKSPIVDSIHRGLGTVLLGNNKEQFEAARASIINGLQAAQSVFGEAIPASDRSVSLGHNSPEQRQAIEKIDRLVEAVTQANDLPGTPEDKEQILAELSAGRKLLEATKVRVAAVRATLQPALRWILEKGAAAAVGKMAGDLWEYLVHLHFW